ncbi:hypothetical protein [Solimonas terrae]|uniref:Uncharacterized protein n=1 Tax=Solimonas terrae TaxID=1396819 RepID=A0A6M2BK72_9GAMM|nr:hypothetical protein [Solimonas terrae]NGY03186.1 hypothetical protein [Solimonas terrae]
MKMLLAAHAAAGTLALRDANGIDGGHCIAGRRAVAGVAMIQVKGLARIGSDNVVTAGEPACRLSSIPTPI